MAFKTVSQHEKAKNGNKFILMNDGDSADVVFLYESFDGVLVADAHYIKSNDYNGYVHCTGRGCPACAKGIRTQNKLFIPLYNITADEIQFWDRTDMMIPALQKDVFDHYPNPSEFVFRVTRHGAYRDRNTRYQIVAIGRNTAAKTSYAGILKKFNVTLPEYYEAIIRDVDANQISAWIAAPSEYANPAYTDLPEYTPTPRVSVTNVSPAITDVANMRTADFDDADSTEEIDEDPQF